MKSGIYRILNTINGKSYVGKSSNIASRWSGHRRSLRKGQHHSNHLQKAWDKYGEGAFVFEILHLEDDPVMLAKMECHFVLSMGTMDRDRGYNLNLVTPASYVASPETRAKLSRIQSALQTEELRKHLSDVQRGVPKSDESKKKMSDVWHDTHKWSDELKEKWSVQRSGRHLSVEARARISDGLKGHTVTQEAKENMSKAQKKIMTPERRAAISAFRKAWWAAKKDAEAI